MKIVFLTLAFLATGFHYSNAQSDKKKVAIGTNSPTDTLVLVA